MSNASSNDFDRQSPYAPPAATAETPAVEEGARLLQLIGEKAATLHKQGTTGAGWFYWVAGLSLVNSVILLSGGDTHFVIGLGVTLIADSVAVGIAQEAPEAATVAKLVALGFDLMVAAAVVGCGWLACRRNMIVFAVGMALYTLDGLLFVFIQDWMSVGFHAFVLYGMWAGFSAFRQLTTLETSATQVAQAARI